MRDLARQRLTGKNYATAIVTLISKARRRYGAYLVHLAVILITMGITGSTAYKRELLVTLQPGDSTACGDYKIQYEDYSVETLHAQPVTYQSKIRYSTRLGVYREGSRVSQLLAEKNYHWAMDTPWVTEVAIYSTLKEDLYIVLADLEQDGTAGFQMVINPLVNWIWIGGGVLWIGTWMAAWPQRQTKARED